MTPTEYEALVAQVAASIVERVDGVAVARLSYGKTSQVVGLSGFSHQIDVAIDGIGASLLIECKSWKNTIDVPRFLEFAARVHDIRSLAPTRQIVAAVATTVGFDSGIAPLAAFFRIGTHVVTSPQAFALIYKDALVLGTAGVALVAESGTPIVQQGLILKPVGSEVTT